ncbi:hypothetical protein ACYPKM_04855 [Pseudomonas aeruginosa]
MYLHGSRKLFTPGFVLLPQPNGYVQRSDSPEFERYLESRRPVGLTSRANSVFLTSDPDLIDAAGGYNDAVYEVQVDGDPEQSDLAWYSEAFIEFESKLYGGTFDQTLLDSYVDAYWAGTPFHDAQRSNMEFRVPRAVVIRIYELNVDEAELERVTPRKSRNLSLEP